MTPRIRHSGMGDSRGPLLLSMDQLELLRVSAIDVVASIEHLLRGVTNATAWNAPKIVITPPDGRYMMATLSASDDPPYLAVKSLIVNDKNKEKGLPVINSIVTLLDSETGLPLAVIDGNWVTAVRTAGLSAVAAARLARPEASVIAFVGCGVQANSHLQMFAELYPLTAVRAFGRGTANKQALCRSAERQGITAHACDDVREAVSGADIVVTSVTLDRNIEPFIDAGWLKAGAFATVTDLAIPWIDETMSVFDRIVIDETEQEAQAEHPLIDASLPDGDLAGLVLGKIDGRCTDLERTAFVFRGLALADLAIAALAYERFIR